MAEKVNISQELEHLVKIQDIDAQIYRLNAEKADKPGIIRQLKELLLQKQSGVKETEAALRNLQVKRKEKEIELESKEATVKKLQVQLYQLKSNKEYAAMLHEIETHKADNSLLEEEILKIMELIDTAEARLGEERKKIEQESRETDNQLQQIEARVKEIENSLSELKANREGIIPSVNPKIFKDYEKILAGKSGLALIEVINDACGGCYMHLPPQVINEIRMKEHIIYCESCQRMLYIRDEQV